MMPGLLNTLAIASAALITVSAVRVIAAYGRAKRAERGAFKAYEKLAITIAANPRIFLSVRERLEMAQAREQAWQKAVADEIENLTGEHNEAD